MGNLAGLQPWQNVTLSHSPSVAIEPAPHNCPPGLDGSLWWCAWSMFDVITALVARTSQPGFFSGGGRQKERRLHRFRTKSGIKTVPSCDEGSQQQKQRASDADSQLPHGGGFNLVYFDPQWLAKFLLCPAWRYGWWNLELSAFKQVFNHWVLSPPSTVWISRTMGNNINVF